MTEVTIADLARLFKVNKSAVNYWVNLGLLESVGVRGKATKIFDLDKAKIQIKNIKARPAGKKLKDLV